MKTERKPRRKYPRLAKIRFLHESGTDCSLEGLSYWHKVARIFWVYTRPDLRCVRCGMTLRAVEWHYEPLEHEPSDIGPDDV